MYNFLYMVQACLWCICLLLLTLFKHIQYFLNLIWKNSPENPHYCHHTENSCTTTAAAIAFNHLFPIPSFSHHAMEFQPQDKTPGLLIKNKKVIPQHYLLVCPSQRGPSWQPARAVHITLRNDIVRHLENNAQRADSLLFRNIPGRPSA